MARPKKGAPIDTRVPHELSEGLIDGLTCPAGLPKVLIRDKKGNGLRVRVTANGAKAFVYEAKINGKAFSKTLGKWGLMTIPDAQAAALELNKTVKNDKRDPRDIKREADEAKARAEADAIALREAAALAAAAKIDSDAKAAAEQMERDKMAALTVGEVWKAYIAERTPFWGDLHRRDHEDKAKPGGLPSGRRGGGKNKTKPGPLAALMPLALKDLDQATIEAWAATEGKTRPASARLAWRLLTVFLTWCTQHPTYAALLPVSNPAKTKKAREALGKAGVKKDVLQRGQLAAWFAAVQRIPNRTISACLQIMLLTGARPGEVLALRWEDLNTQWKGINIRDKVEGEREIPATPYVLELLSSLPRVNNWVFASARYVKGKRSINCVP